MPKLSDAHAILLSAAGTRADLSVLPVPNTLDVKGAALERTLDALLRRGLIARAPAKEGRNAKGRAVVDAGINQGGNLIVTAAGLTAVGLGEANSSPAAQRKGTEAPAPAQPAPARPAGKMGALLDAVSRSGGATIEDLTAASGWLPHTTRAALTRLRRRGFDVRLVTDGGRKAYRLAASV